MSCEVQLAVYDLSRGMARQLSTQFIGTPLECIPHTGIVVHGREYFFGSGIQYMSPAEFRSMTQMFPFQTLKLGRTNVSQAQFDAWCSSQMAEGGRFTMQSYDLFERNCNHFSHEAALQGLKLSQGVPQWILDVPRQFLASPMGQMVRPMLQQMQVNTATMGAGNQFATFQPSARAAAPVPAPAPNPWAHISTSSATAPASTTTTTSSRPKPAAANETKPAAVAGIGATPLLDSFNKPLRSQDTKMVQLCVDKIKTFCQTDEERASLDQTAASLLQSSSSSSSPDNDETTNRILMRCFETGKGATFALLLLRIMVLSSDSSSSPCLDWIVQQLTTQTPSVEVGVDGSATTTSQLLESNNAATRGAAWLTLSNAVAAACDNDDKKKLFSIDTQAVVDAALADLASDNLSVQVGQALCGFLYNITLWLTMRQPPPNGTDDDLLLSLLCASLEGMNGDEDPTMQLRRLMIAGRTIKPLHGGSETTTHKQLAVDLGFADSLKVVAQVKKTNHQDAAKAQQLAKELLHYLQN